MQSTSYQELGRHRLADSIAVHYVRIRPFTAIHVAMRLSKHQSDPLLPRAQIKLPCVSSSLIRPSWSCDLPRPPESSLIRCHADTALRVLLYAAIVSEFDC